MAKWERREPFAGGTAGVSVVIRAIGFAPG